MNYSSTYLKQLHVLFQNLHFLKSSLLVISMSTIQTGCLPTHQILQALLIVIQLPFPYPMSSLASMESHIPCDHWVSCLIRSYILQGYFCRKYGKVLIKIQQLYLRISRTTSVPATIANLIYLLFVSSKFRM